MLLFSCLFHCYTYTFHLDKRSYSSEKWHFLFLIFINIYILLMSEWIYICIYFLWTDFYGNYSNIVLKWGGVFEISSTKLKIKKKNFSFFYNRGMSEIKEKNKEIKILCWFACAIWFLKINTEIMHLKCCKTLNMQYLKHKIFDLILLIPTINKITQILWLMQLNNVCQLLQSLQIQKHLEFNFYKKCIWFLKKKKKVSYTLFVPIQL